MEQLAQQGAEAVHGIFPFLSPDQFQQAATLMKEGRAAPVAQLRAIHPKAGPALTGNVVDVKLKPYFDALVAHVPAGNYYAGFKLLRESEDQPEKENADTSGEPGSEEASESGPEGESEETAQPVLHWFFLPLAAKSGARYPDNLVAWEATSRSGRATYFFRLVPPEQASQLQDASRGPALIDSAIRQLNRAIVLLNFRREPIYLPDDSLLIQPRFRRYAIACRKLPELVRLRSSFLGRAIHASNDTWQRQFEGFLATK